MGRYKLTEFQAEVILETRSDRLVVGDYFIMIGSGKEAWGLLTDRDGVMPTILSR